MKNFEDLSDEELLKLNEKIVWQRDYRLKIDEAARILQLKYIPLSPQRIINNQRLSIDIRPRTEEETQIFGDWYVPTYRANFLKLLIDDLNLRLKKQETPADEIELIKAELKATPPYMRSGDLIHGYNAQERSKPFEFKHLPLPYSGTDFNEVAKGAAYFLYKKELNNLLADRMSSGSVEVVDVTKIPRFKNKTMQMLALYELGIIEHLRNRYPTLKKNDSALGNLLSGILQVYDKKGIETIRRHIGNTTKSIGEKSALQSDDINEELREELSKVGIITRSIE